MNEKRKYQKSTSCIIKVVQIRKQILDIDSSLFTTSYVPKYILCVVLNIASVKVIISICFSIYILMHMAQHRYKKGKLNIIELRSISSNLIAEQIF